MREEILDLRIKKQSAKSKNTQLQPIELYLLFPAKSFIATMNKDVLYNENRLSEKFEEAIYKHEVPFNAKRYRVKLY